MAETASGIYYPTTGNPVRVPADMQRLAESIDGRVATIYQATEVTRTTNSLGSFSSPIKVEVPKVKENQAVEITVLGYLKSSVELKSNVAFLGVAVNSVNSEGWSVFGINEEALAANAALKFHSTGGAGGFAKSVQVFERGKLFYGGTGGQVANPFLFVAEADDEDLTVEFMGKMSGGTLTVGAVWLQARVIG